MDVKNPNKLPTVAPDEVLERISFSINFEKKNKCKPEKTVEKKNKLVP
jgi:hypothetical protein